MGLIICGKEDFDFFGDNIKNLPQDDKKGIEEILEQISLESANITITEEDLDYLLPGEERLESTEIKKNRRVCQDCNQIFYAKGKNARFCPECAQRRKIAADKKAWGIRKNKKNIQSGMVWIDRHPNLIESTFRKRLGIGEHYTIDFKTDYKREYEKWSMRLYKILEKADEKGSGLNK